MIQRNPAERPQPMPALTDVLAASSLEPDAHTKPHNAVLVAHPDDETLWAGQTLLDHPGDWTVISCTIPRLDPIRGWKFYDACEHLGAHGRLFPAVEPGPSGSIDYLNALHDALLEYDLVLTHGGAGEYGNAHHRQVHLWAMQTLRNARLVFAPNIEHAHYALERKTEWGDVLRCYDHPLPYGPLGTVPKWQALLHRYGEPTHEGLDLVPLWHWHALADMVRANDWTRGAELGVRAGFNLFNLLAQCPDLHMLGVDLFQPLPGNTGEGQETYAEWPWEEYQNMVDSGAKWFDGRCAIMKSDTVAAAAHVEDGSLDFVFVDADHSYAGVKRDLEAWLPKIRKGGFMTGHDIHFEGVKKAVDEAFGDAYLTDGWDRNYLWWVAC